MRKPPIFLACLLAAASHADENCSGTKHPLEGYNSTLLADGSLVGWSRNHVNVDGMRTAYHRVGTSQGAMTSVCNAGEAYLPNGSHFHGSAKGKCDAFLLLYRTALEKGWDNPKIGVIRWYGVIGTGSAVITGKTITGVTPKEQPDGSGFYVSPTVLQDSRFEVTDQRRYLNAEEVPYATIKFSDGLKQRGATKGSYGVAYNKTTKQTVPFVIGDHGPKVGEGSFALSKLLAGKPNLPATRPNVYAVSIDDNNILWVLFGKAGGQATPPYTATSVKQGAASAFETWGGQARLNRCIANGEI